MSLSWTSCLQGYSWKLYVVRNTYDHLAMSCLRPGPSVCLCTSWVSCMSPVLESLYPLSCQWSIHQEALLYNINMWGWLRGASLELVLCLMGVPLSLGFQPYRVQILDVHVPLFSLKFIAGLGVRLSAAANFTIKVFR